MDVWGTLPDEARVELDVARVDHARDGVKIVVTSALLALAVYQAMLIAAAATVVVGARLPALEDDLPERYEQLEERRDG